MTRPLRHFGRLSLCVYVLSAAAIGCGGPPATLTPAQIEKQNAEDKINLKAEDEAEAAFQKEQKKKR